MKMALSTEPNEPIKNKKPGKRPGERFEAILTRAGIAALLITIAVQAVLLSPDIRPVIFFENIEGSPLGQEAFLFVPCKMELELTNLSRCPSLKVLVNGIERASFEGKTVMLDLKDGDVVELDSSGVPVGAQVLVSAVSRNIEKLLGRKITAEGGITTVSRINTF